MAEDMVVVGANLQVSGVLEVHMGINVEVHMGINGINDEMAFFTNRIL